MTLTYSYFENINNKETLKAQSQQSLSLDNLVSYGTTITLLICSPNADLINGDDAAFYLLTALIVDKRSLTIIIFLALRPRQLRRRGQLQLSVLPRRYHQPALSKQ
jgi:hypothetical protein